MPYLITAVISGLTGLIAGVKGAFTYDKATSLNEGITPTKIVIYGGAALALYLILKKNKLV
jgi:hypothetical protein